MPEIRVTLSITVDGNPLPDMPVVKTVQVAEAAQIGNLVAAADNNTTSYHGIGAAEMPTMSVFFLTADQAMNYKVNGSATAIPMNAGSLVLLISSNLSQGTPANNVQFNNPAATTSANLSGLVAGT